VTRSGPEELGLHTDGHVDADSANEKSKAADRSSAGVAEAVRSASFWLILAGSTLVIGAIGAVIQHFILFLKDAGYTPTAASRFFTILLTSSLGGRVLVGYVADRFRKSSIMALFYLLIGASTFLLAWPHSPAVLWTFALVFGFSMGADYMLIPLVTAESFGTASLAKLLALIIMGYSLGQWGAPWMAGRIFDVQHSYDLAWKLMAIAGIAGAAAIYVVSALSSRKR
jgi:MFS family permease